MTTKIAPPGGASAPSSTVALSTPVRLLAGANRLFAQYALVIVLLAMVGIFSVIEPSTYFTTQNAQTIAATKAVVALLALAAMVPLATGQFDISVGFQLGLSQTLCAGLIINDGMAPSVALLLTLLAGASFGLINAFLVVRMRIGSFIATLASGTLALGITQWYSGGQSIFGAIPSSFTNLGRHNMAGIPLPIIYVVVVVAILWLLFEYTAWGRACYAIGSNPRAALIAGVRVDRLTTQSFVLSGVLCSAAGVLSVMNLGSANPAVGPDFLLPAFAGAFLGATSIRPGRFNAIGTFVAVYLLAAGITGLQQEGAAFYVESFFNAGALLIAVALSAYAIKRRKARVIDDA
jgi:ribose transport system permease protein